MKTMEVPESTDGVLTSRHIGAGQDAESHLIRLTVDDPFTGERVVDRLMVPEAAYRLGMQLVRASTPRNRVVLEVDVEDIIRGMLEQEEHLAAVLKRIREQYGDKGEGA